MGREKNQGKNVTPGFSYIIVLMMCVFVLTKPSQAARAQGDDILIVQAPNTSRFPEITLQFKLPVSLSDLNSDLDASDLTIYEDGQPLTLESLSKERGGIHFTLVINPGRQLDLRDQNGISPFEKIRETLLDWSQSHSSYIGDRWSFVNDAGVEVSNSNTRQNWVDALTAYQPEFRRLEPDQRRLETAINLASEWVVPFGVDKSMLYITPAPSQGQLELIDQLSLKAKSAGIEVNVWMVDEPYYLTNDQGGVLMDLAENTGGEFFHFTGTESIPNPEAYLSDLGIYFKLSYQSSIRQTGTYPVEIKMTGEMGEVSGESGNFYVEVNPPNPILISPPAVINRTLTEAQSENFSPSDQRIEIMVEFPDSHPRPIVESRLYVDGDVVDERNSPPYNVLNWDLRSIVVSGEQSIQVEVEDSLGLSARTMLTPVQVVVVMPEPEESLSPGRVGLILLSILAVISIILLISWLVRRYWGSEHFKTFLPARRGEGVIPEPFSLKSTFDEKKVQALLLPLEGKPGELADAVQIVQSRVNIGSDPLRSDLLIKNPDVAGLHALFLQQDGQFWLADIGSSKGTWVNYVKIGKQPVRIVPGDVVYFGDLGFRFIIVDNLKDSQVRIEKYEPIL